MRLSWLVLVLALAPLLPAAEPVSRSFTNDQAAAGNSMAPMLTPNGTDVLFVSNARNLVSNRVDGEFLNLFLHNISSSNTVLVSVGANGEGANGDSAWHAASRDAQYVSFISEASNLVAGDTNGSADVFLRHLQSQTTTLITLRNDGEASNGVSITNQAPLISDDGQFVVFESSSPGLSSSGDTNGTVDVYLHAVPLKFTMLISKARRADASPSRGSVLAAATPDARYVAFLSTAGDELVEDAGNLAGADLYIRDLATDSVYWASPLSNWYDSGYNCLAAALSTNGQHALVYATANHALGNCLFRHDLTAGATLLVASNLPPGQSVHISGDGRYVVYADATNVYRWDANTAGRQLVSANTSGAVPLLGQSLNPRMAADGNTIAFVSNAPGLDTNASTGAFQLYIRDMNLTLTRLVTALPSGFRSGMSSECSNFELSQDGAWIAFDGRAPDLVPNDLNNQTDVFLAASNPYAVRQVSLRHGSAAVRQTAAAHSRLGAAAISTNGSAVAIVSYDAHFVANDTNGVTDVFIVKPDTGSTFGIAGGMVGAAAVSGDGRYMLFLGRNNAWPNDWPYNYRWFDSVAGANVDTGIRGPDREPIAPAVSPDGSAFAVFNRSFWSGFTLFNTQFGTNEFEISTAAEPIQAPDRCHALFTADSRFLILAEMGAIKAYDRISKQFHVAGSNAPLAVSGNSKYLAFVNTNVLWLHDLQAQTSAPISTNLSMVTGISGNGRFVAGERSLREVGVVDSQTGAFELVSVTRSGRPGNHISRWPAISIDGRFVAFVTRANDVADGNPGAWQQVILRDRLLGISVTLSSSRDGRPGNHHSGRPYFSADGSRLFFQSLADNLVAGDLNDKRDVFMVRINRGDSDSDGLDDDWEIAFFNNLSPDGAGDFDADGQTDRAEFMAGTDPTNSGSIFRVLSLTPLGAGSRQIIWSGNSARYYRVEYKDDLHESQWSVLDADVSWTETTATAVDSAPASTRYYRVVRL